MAKKDKIEQTEVIERDLPEPGREPADLTVEVDTTLLPKTVIEGKPTKIVFMFEGRHGAVTEQNFHIVATRGPGKPEVKVIGAAHVTIE